MLQQSAPIVGGMRTEYTFIFGIKLPRGQEPTKTAKIRRDEMRMNMHSLLKLRSIAAITVLIVAAAMLFYGPNAFSGPGEDLFKSKCAMCHGPDGGGNTVMGKNLKIRDLRSAEIQKQTDAQLAEVITKGKNKMPSYEQKISKEQISELVKVIRELGKKH